MMIVCVGNERRQTAKTDDVVGGGGDNDDDSSTSTRMYSVHLFTVAQKCAVFSCVFLLTFFFCVPLFSSIFRTTPSRLRSCRLGVVDSTQQCVIRKTREKRKKNSQPITISIVSALHGLSRCFGIFHTNSLFGSLSGPDSFFLSVSVFALNRPRVLTHDRSEYSQPCMIL